MEPLKLLMGIDEAGRGPVLGPLVAAGVVLESARCEQIKLLGIKDSKKLSPKQRDIFFEIIEHDSLWYSIVVAWPDLIDSHVEQGKLNELECKMFSSIINSYGLEADIYVDSPLKPNIFRAQLDSMVLGNYNINCSFKADDIYPVVSCASVLAKVVRDDIIEELKLEYGDFGSGYPSDKKTVNYLLKSKELPFFTRRSWKTLKNLELL